RLRALQRPVEAGLPNRAAAAERLRELHVLRGLGEPQVGVVPAGNLDPVDQVRDRCRHLRHPTDSVVRGWLILIGPLNGSGNLPPTTTRPRILVRIRGLESLCTGQQIGTGSLQECGPRTRPAGTSRCAPCAVIGRVASKALSPLMPADRLRAALAAAP